ncbi:hypothetical protein [Nostoc sp.]|uniref:hypothetical protein n=1 Tax=Nostoc sp. TaxID=1180 RepID=UPI002FF7E556
MQISLRKFKIGQADDRTFSTFSSFTIAPLPNPDKLSAIASHPNSKPLVRQNQRTNKHRRSQLLWLN